MNRPARAVWLPLAVGAVALLLGLVRLASTPEAFFRSWLPAWLFWTAIPAGSLGWLMIHRLTGGAWGEFAGPALRAGAGTLPVCALAFLPLALGLGHVYGWAAPEPGAALAGGKALWLRPGFFLAREMLVLTLWLIMAWRQGLRPYGQPSHREPPGAGAAALGLILLLVSVTVFAIDWLMALEPRWSSANVGFLAAGGALLAALGLATLTLCLRAPESPPATTAARCGDLGGLLLAILLLWGYLAFQQYLTIWAENLPDKALWYTQRNAGGWRAWAWTLAAVGGVLPFCLLLFRTLKRDPRRLAWAAWLILLGRLLDLYWQAMPAFYPTPGLMSVLDALPLIAIGGPWVAVYVWLLPRRRAERRVEESAHG